MERQSFLEFEILLLAQQWQPGIIDEVLRYFLNMKTVHQSEKMAFVETYERYFLNPSAEGVHR